MVCPSQACWLFPSPHCGSTSQAKPHLYIQWLPAIVVYSSAFDTCKDQGGASVHIGQGRLGEADSIDLAMGKPSWLLSYGFLGATFWGMKQPRLHKKHLMKPNKYSLVPKSELWWNSASVCPWDFKNRRCCLYLPLGRDFSNRSFLENTPMIDGF